MVSGLVLYIMNYIVSVRYYTEIYNSDMNNQEMGASASVNQLGTNTYSAKAKIIRNKLKDYFSSDGAVEFQYDKLLYNAKNNCVVVNVIKLYLKKNL